MPQPIRLAVIGVGNCACSLIQGLNFYQHSTDSNNVGLLYEKVGPYHPDDIQIVTAFDIDTRKVGLDVHEAIFAKPNNTTLFSQPTQPLGVTVKMGKILDSVAEHMQHSHSTLSIEISNTPEATKEEVISELKATKSEILINYLPVGSEQATRFYAECALEAGVAFINCIPVFIASDTTWQTKFKEKKLALIGDDIKSQFGATILHRTLVGLMKKRGVNLKRTYQLNVGGNTDFFNMQDRERLKSKKISKTESVQTNTSKRLDDDNIHIGPSDFIPWVKDNKIAFVRLEAEIFGSVPIELECRLSVEDSPNSAGVAIDMIRFCKLAMDRGEYGPLSIPSSYFCKHPPEQMGDNQAFKALESYINDK